MEAQALVKCDECGNSEKIWLSGHDQKGNQVYVCSNPVHGRHRFITSKTLKTKPKYVNYSHISAIIEGAKNMDTSLKAESDVGEKTKTADYSLVNFAWQQKKKGKKGNTITTRLFYLKWLESKGAKLPSPDSVETILCTEPMTGSMRYGSINAYKAYCKVNKILWDDPPKSGYQAKEPFTPTAEEVNTIICKAGKVTAAFLQLLATTGMRTGEALRLTWADIDSEALTIAVNSPEKGSNTRTIPVPIKTIAMISDLKHKYEPYVFNPNGGVARSNLVHVRKTAANNQKNPRLLRIHLHSFRHYFAKKKLLETNYKPCVQYLMGHKSSSSTDRYTKSRITL